MVHIFIRLKIIQPLHVLHQLKVHNQIEILLYATEQENMFCNALEGVCQAQPTWIFMQTKIRGELQRSILEELF